jgi:hypothetical protein
VSVFPGMREHPPIHISELAYHIEQLRANNNNSFTREYEVCFILMYSFSVYFLVLTLVASESLMYSKYPWFFIVGIRNYCENIENVF